jgi:hypothetical protein
MLLGGGGCRQAAMIIGGEVRGAIVFGKVVLIKGVSIS